MDLLFLHVKRISPAISKENPPRLKPSELHGKLNGEGATMARSGGLLAEWENPLFLTLPSVSRDLYFFALTGSPPAAPLGLVWHQGDKHLSALARKAQVSFPKGIPPLVEVGLAAYDDQHGLLYLPKAMLGGAIALYNSRNISSWAKRAGQMPESDLKEVWRRDLIKASAGYPKAIREKIFSIFASRDDLGKLEGKSDISQDAVELVRYFSDKFKFAMQCDYVASWSREVQIAKQLLMSLSFEDLKIRIDLYFKDEWLCNNTSMDFMAFRRNINKFAKGSRVSVKKSDLSGYWDIVKRESK